MVVNPVSEKGRRRYYRCRQREAVSGGGAGGSVKWHLKSTYGREKTNPRERGGRMLPYPE